MTNSNLRVGQTALLLWDLGYIFLNFNINIYTHTLHTQLQGQYRHTQANIHTHTEEKHTFYWTCQNYCDLVHIITFAHADVHCIQHWHTVTQLQNPMSPLHCSVLITTFPSWNVKEEWKYLSTGHTHTQILTFSVNLQLNLRGALQSYKDARHGSRHGRQDTSVNPNLNWTPCWLTCCCRALLHVTAGQFLPAAVIQLAAAAAGASASPSLCHNRDTKFQCYVMTQKPASVCCLLTLRHLSWYNTS